MIIHFDGGLRKQLICIFDTQTNLVKIAKRKYDNEDYEWDALELALDYLNEWSIVTGDVELVGDNNQVTRWIQAEKPENDSIVKQKCWEKLSKLRKNRRVIGIWVKRNENLAGRCLEYWTSRSGKPIIFEAVWYSCSRCVFKSLSEKEKEEHFYNNHVTNG